MKQNYIISDHFKVDSQDYELKATIHQGRMTFQGAYHKPGDSSWYTVSEVEVDASQENLAGQLSAFVDTLPAEVQMPMNAFIVHLFTVYRFLYPNYK